MFAGHAAPGQVVASCVAVTVAAACFVIVRLYARFIITRSAGWDDGFIVISLVGASNPPIHSFIHSFHPVWRFLVDRLTVFFAGE
jgi:hypothetical protein